MSFFSECIIQTCTNTVFPIKNKPTIKVYNPFNSISSV